ncbi:DNA-binding transcriptional regulator, MocR family, contains an aminotransferase domain [Nakamurella panacisegetis]|uniref:DNA-binding transcriptional regulator, MocR family, contains an aminotransferase domain n=1 Tax=Nakamurella panacisegetis TaxID=1090615 RepID=A0A1H0L4K7_9ACTN|nr:PLP-dependent aminotransferase family protein [Nakamurella panacisegetis]SDO63167.1 DNA-binding transcriptional regulator, MocR family, contains an aminotransferase domain [Nakamurella panacisegetis]
MTGNSLDRHMPLYAQRTAGMRASAVRSLFAVANRPEVVSLAGGMPYLQSLPLESVAAEAAQLIAQDGLTALQYGSGQGILELREQICQVMALEGITAHPDDVTVTVGSQMALDLVTRIFCDPGDVILAEAPSYVGALTTFASYQAKVVHIEMDSDGLIPSAVSAAIESVRAAGGRIKFLYTIPNFHNPAGVTMSDARRQELAKICREANIPILEDNPYGLLGFDDKIRRSIRADDAENVIYLGSFSKTFAPGLRVGWVLAPHAVREKLVLANESATLNPPVFNQMMVSRYLANFDWQSQVKAYRHTYAERRDAMIQALETHMPEGTTWTNPEGGFFVWVTLPEGFDTAAMLPRAVTARVAYVPGTAFYADGLGSRQMRLSFCFPTPERIVEGIRRLATVLDNELDVMRTFGATTAALPAYKANRGPSSPSPDIY